MKRALITGGAGFLGRHLIAHLRQHEPTTRLRLLCRSTTPLEHGPAIEIVRGDITDPACVLEAMEGVDEVYHLAGRVSRATADRQVLFKIHVEGARNVCAAAARCRPERLVVVSTSGVIAVSRRPKVHDERSGYPYGLVSDWPYYLSKLFAEKLVLSATVEHGLPTVIVNPTLIVGPDGGLASTNAVLAPFLDGRLPAVPRGGLSLVDVRDVAAMLPAAARLGRIGERYLLTALNCTFRQLACRIAALNGRPARLLPTLPASLTLDVTRVLGLLPGIAQRLPIDEEGLQMSSLFWYADASRARTELGFKPRDPNETLAATIADLLTPGSSR